MVPEVGAQCHSRRVFVSSLDATPNGDRLVHCCVQFLFGSRVFVLYGRLSEHAVPVVEPGPQHSIFQQPGGLCGHVSAVQTRVETKESIRQRDRLLPSTTKLCIYCLEGPFLFLLELRWDNECVVFFVALWTILLTAIAIYYYILLL